MLVHLIAYPSENLAKIELPGVDAIGIMTWASGKTATIVGTVAEAEDRTGCLNKYQEITTLMLTDSNISVILFIDKQTRLMLFQVINDVY